MQVLVGLRNGTMLQLTASTEVAVTNAAEAPLLHLPLPQLQLTAIKELGSLPVVLVPLPTAAGLVGASLALSDRMALLSSAPGTGRAVASPLAVAGVTHAAPLWQPASSLSGNSISRQDSLLGWSFLPRAMHTLPVVWKVLCVLLSKCQARNWLCLSMPLTVCACPCVACMPCNCHQMPHATCCTLHSLVKSQTRQKLSRQLGHHWCGASSIGRLARKTCRTCANA